MCDLGIALLQQAFLNVNLEVPADEKKSAWAAKSDTLQHRIKITRSGEKIAGGTCQIAELIDIRVVVADNAPKNVIADWKAVAAEHARIVTFSAAPPGAAFEAFAPKSDRITGAAAKPASKGAPKAQNTIMKKPGKR